MFGLLNLDKPAGVTSRDAVNRVQRLVKPHKVGHCGTLDPLATGVLVIAIGPATRLVEYVQRMPKTYRGTFLLGHTSDTEDIEGAVVEMANPSIPTEQQLLAALPRFIGTIQQVPPAYSALKVAGQRSYDLARRGQPAELQQRPVEIQSIDLLRYEYPALELRIRCGSGTYIRSLGRDLARAVGSEAVMSALTREAIGPFTIEDALIEARFENATRELIEQSLVPPAAAIGDMPRVVVDEMEMKGLAQGRSLIGPAGAKANELAALSPAGDLVAILTPDDRGGWRPTKNFAAVAMIKLD
jgi:tRNA pseudouridine55 synthase